MNDIIQSTFNSYIPPVSKENPYTYISALQYSHADVWDDAERLVNEFAGTQIMTAHERRESAVSFLRSMASQQRANEIAFVKNEIEKLKSLERKQQIPDLKEQIASLEKDIKELKYNNFNYPIFIKNLNAVIKDVENYKVRLSTLQHNFQHTNSERGLLENVDIEFKKIISLLNDRKRAIEENKKSYETLAAEFITNFVKANEDKLRSALVDDRLFAAWLLRLSTQFRVYLEKIHTQERDSLERNYRTDKDNLEKNFNNFIKENQNQLFSFSDQDLKLLKELATSMEITKFNPELTRANLRLPTLQNKQSSSDYSVIFTSNFEASALDERMGLLVRNCFQAFLQMGGAGMGNDSIGATVTLLFGEPNYNRELEEVEKALKELDKAWTEFSKLRDQRQNVLENNRKMNEKIENIMLQLDHDLAAIDDSSHAFIIHESDKYYMSMEKGFEVGWRTHQKGFHGRTIAILNYIDIMQNLQFDFGMGDPQLMKFMAYNIEANSPGAHAKGIMEEIFTYAASMIMFDDASVAVKEATKELEFSNVTNIHLYKLQELYFPASYLLEQTADYLEGLELDLETNNAAIAHIDVGDNIYAPGYINLEKNEKKRQTIDKSIASFIRKSPEERWETMKNRMISQTKVSISFFLNFADFIAKLPH